MKTTPTHSSEEKATPISRTGSGWLSISNLACLLAIAAVPAYAQNISETWDGGGGDNNWSTAANWTNDTVPINQFVDFAGTTQTSTNNDITAGKYIYEMRLKNTTSGQSFTLGGNSVFVNNAVRTSDVASGNITDVINLNIDMLDSKGNWIIGTNHDLIMNGSAGFGGDQLKKSGGGTLTLAGANTYTGATTVNEGTLNVTNSSLTPSYTIASGAILNLSGADPAAGNTTFYGGGTLNILDNAFFNANNGDFAMDSGALIDVKSGQLGFNGGGDQWTGNLADLNVAAAGSMRGAGNDIEINSLTGSGTFNMSGGIIKLGQDNGTGATFSGNFGKSYGTGSATGSASRIEKNGTGTQTLTGNFDLGAAGSITVNDGKLVLATSTNVNYGGATTINGGTLELQSTSGFRSYIGGDININNGSTLRFSVNGGNGYVLDAADTINFGSSGGGLMDAASGNFIVRGSTITTAGGAENTIQGSFNMDSGDVIFDVATDNGDAVDLTVDALLGNAQGIVKQGAGTMKLTANNDYTGTTTVSEGTLIINGDHSAATGAVNVGGGILDATLAGSGTLGGTTTIGANGFLSPGNSPGTMTITNLDWNDGGTYLWEINADLASSGGEGVDSGWDLINVTSDWDISGITSSFNIDITSLTNPGNIAGLADGFDYSGKAYLDPYESFTILSFGSLTGTFDASEFNLLTGNFANSKVDWNIDIVGNDLVLNAVFVPEPSSAALLGLGGLALMLRRKRSAA